MKRKAPVSKQSAIKSFCTGPGQVECPLCGLMFHQALIERHAAGCGATRGPTPAALAPSSHAFTSPIPAPREPPSSSRAAAPSTAPDTGPHTAPDTASSTASNTAPDTAPDTAPHTAPDTASSTASNTAPDTAPDTAPNTAPDTAPGPTQDAFSLLRSAQAKQTKQQQQSRGTFRVDLLPSDRGVRLMPSFVLDSDGHGQGQGAGAATVWTCESNVRRLLVGGGQDGSERCQSFVLTLATNIPPGTDAPASTSPPVHAAVLKSMLQKATRRHRHPHVLRLCAALFEASAADLLRRLVVVGMEDACLHPALPVLVWAMAAQARGYVLPDVLTASVLHLCAELGAGSCRDSELRASSPPRWRLAELPPGPARTLVLCLALRGAHGGLEGDVRMLEGFAGLWSSRLFPQEESADADANADADTSASAPASADPADLKASAEEEEAALALPPALAAALPLALYLHPLAVMDLLRRPWGRACVDAYCCTDSLQAGPPDCVPAPCPLRALASCPDMQHLRRGLMRDLSLGANTAYITGGSSSSISKGGGGGPRPSVLSALPLRRRDLVPEGLDPHCDSGLLPRLLARCQAGVWAALAAAEGRRGDGQASFTPDPSPASVASSDPDECSDAIKSAIWTFTGSINTRAHDKWLCPPGCEAEARAAAAWAAERTTEALATKRERAGVWKVVAPQLNLLVQQRLEELGARLPP